MTQRIDGLVGVLLDGRYRVGAVLARGGMSTVYRGIDVRLDRPVAIKVMAPGRSSRTSTPRYTVDMPPRASTGPTR